MLAARFSLSLCLSLSLCVLQTIYKPFGMCVFLFFFLKIDVCIVVVVSFEKKRNKKKKKKKRIYDMSLLYLMDDFPPSGQMAFHLSHTHKHSGTFKLYLSSVWLKRSLKAMTGDGVQLSVPSPPLLNFRYTPIIKFKADWKNKERRRVVKVAQLLFFQQAARA